MAYFEYIYNLYYLSFALFVLMISLTIDVSHLKVNHKFVNVFSVLFLFSIIFIIGLRDIDVGTDTIEYYTYKWQMELYTDSSEILLDLVVKTAKYFSFSFSIVLLFISFLYYYFFYKSFKIFAKYYSVLPILLFFIFISLFFSLSMGINVIRQGMSLAFIVYSLALIEINKSKKWSIFYAALAFISHTTAVIPLLLYLFCKLFTKRIDIKYFYLLFILGVFFSAINLGLLNVAPFLNDILQGSRRVGYLTQSSEIYPVGFKPQFVAFNTIFLVFFIFMKSKLEKIYESKEMLDLYNLLIKYYIVSSFMFFMAFQIPYSDRWGLFSWIVIPILIAPAFSIKSRIFNKTILTSFFIFIYIFFQFYGTK